MLSFKYKEFLKNSMGGKMKCELKVRAWSSEGEVHKAENVVGEELYRIWQTGEPATEAWLVLELRPPSAFNRLRVVNAGSALVEVFGLREDDDDDKDHDDDGGGISGEEIESRYRMLLSSQQLMSARDVLAKSGRSRAFDYEVPSKLSPLASEHRWRQVRVVCRQPFGNEEHKSCIGLSRFDIIPCKSAGEVAAEAAERRLQKGMEAELAVMFPNIRSNEKASQVTEAKRPFAGPTNTTDGNSKSPQTPRERRLPSWFSTGTTKDPSEAGLSSKDNRSSSHVKHMKDAGGSSALEASESRKKMVEKGKTLSLRHQEGETESKSPSNTQSEQQSALKTNSKKQLPEGIDSESPSNIANKKLKADISSSKIPSNLNEKEMESNGKSGISLNKGPNSKGHKDESKQMMSSLTSKSDEEWKIKGRPGSVHSNKDNGKDIGTSNTIQTSSSGKRTSMSMQCEGRENALEGNIIEETERSARPFNKLLEGVVFAISGIVNPERAEIRKKALDMGAQYRPDWTSDCTLLVTAFANTPKFLQVKGDNGTIVSKKWILECDKRSGLAEIDPYLMNAGKPWRQFSTLSLTESERGVLQEQNDSAETQVHSNSGHKSGKASRSIPHCSVDEARNRMDGLVSLSDLKKWVREDFAASIGWLLQQDNKPDFTELGEIARQGVLLCLEDCLNNLKENKSLQSILETWAFIPRAIREVAATEEKGKHTKRASKDGMVREIERMKSIYEDELKKIKDDDYIPELKAEQPKVAVLVENCNDNSDDDATELISDDEYRDLLDSDSDATEVMDEDDIKHAQEALLLEYGKSIF